MFISEMQIKDLDLDYIFDRIKVDTPYGELQKRNCVPYKRSELTCLEKEFDQLEKVLLLLENHRYDLLELKSCFSSVKQLGGTFERLESGETLSVTELFEIKVLVLIMDQIKALLQKMHWTEKGLFNELDDMSATIEILDPEKTKTQSFYIYSMYSEEIRAIRNEMDQIQKRLKHQTEQIKENLQTHELKVKVNGDIFISKTAKEQLAFAEQHELLEYQSEMPTVVIYRIKQNQKVLDALETLKLKEEEEEYRIRTALSLEIKTHLEGIVENTLKIGIIDYLLAKAAFSKAFLCVRPILNEEQRISVTGGRHIKVENRLIKEYKAYTPIDVDINEKVTLITGANMGGKTVSMKMIGLLVAMVHYGLFVPCKSANICLFDFIFVSVGDSQSIDMGLSTFGGEIQKIGQILKREHEHGFILIDELARGTNPTEGYALSRALIEHLGQSQWVSVITTHYDGLTAIKGVMHYQVKGLSSVDFEKLTGEKGMVLLHELMDYRLAKASNIKEIPKDAIRISEFMGLDQRIINKAKALLGGSNGK